MEKYLKSVAYYTSQAKSCVLQGKRKRLTKNFRQPFMSSKIIPMRTALFVELILSFQTFKRAPFSLP